MSWFDRITTSIFGRRIGLQSVTTGVSGSAVSGKLFDLLVGPEDVRKQVSTGDTTSANLSPFGVSRLTTAASSGVYTLDPPIPGVGKTLVFDTTGTNPIYVKTQNNEYISSTQMTTATVIASSQTAWAVVNLIGISTAQWATMNSVSSGYVKLSTST